MREREIGLREDMRKLDEEQDTVYIPELYPEVNSMLTGSSGGKPLCTRRHTNEDKSLEASP